MNSSYNQHHRSRFNSAGTHPHRNTNRTLPQPPSGPRALRLDRPSSGFSPYPAANPVSRHKTTQRGTPAGAPAHPVPSASLAVPTLPEPPQTGLLVAGPCDQLQLAAYISQRGCSVSNAIQVGAGLGIEKQNLKLLLLDAGVEATIVISKCRKLTRTLPELTISVTLDGKFPRCTFEAISSDPMQVTRSDAYKKALDHLVGENDDSWKCRILTFAQS